MRIRKFRAANMHDALSLVRTELGPEASVLETREVRVGWRRRAEIEVTASTEVNVPSRVPALVAQSVNPIAASPVLSAATAYQPDDAGLDLSQLSLPATETSSESNSFETQSGELPGGLLFELFAQLIDLGIPDELARQLIERVGGRGPMHDLETARRRAVEIVEQMIRTTGSIQVANGEQRVVALVGPTGVGKTTTIAKLAANFRLRDQRRVGLITVDTYRIAAVEQLRTYADIIDLPMEVVSSPREMRAAIARLNECDLILMDTAGRSPRDEVKIRELKLILAEAEADETHLVLSSVASATNLTRTVQKFQSVGLSSLLFTKLDESATLGHLLAVTDDCRLPISYVTHGQNVPNDIEAAQADRLGERMLEFSSL